MTLNVGVASLQLDGNEPVERAVVELLSDKHMSLWIEKKGDIACLKDDIASTGLNGSLSVRVSIEAPSCHLHADLTPDRVISVGAVIRPIFINIHRAVARLIPLAHESMSLHTKLLFCIGIANLRGSRL